MTFGDLVPLGPTFILKSKVEPRKMKRRFTAEVWLYQDGSRLMELSTKCTPGETFGVVAETRAYLAGLGIEFDTSGSTKTRSALNYFRSRIGRRRESRSRHRRRPPSRRSPRAAT